MQRSSQFIGILLWVPGVIQAQVAVPDQAAQQPPETPKLLRQIPQTLEEINTRLEAARARQNELLTLVKSLPAEESAPTDNLRIARESLADAWGILIQRLEHVRSLQERIAALRSEEGIRQRTDELAAVDKRSAEIRNLPAPIGASDEAINKVEEEQKQLEGRISDVVEAQTARAAKSAPAAQKQRDDLEAQLAALRIERDERNSRLESARSNASPGQLQVLQLELEQVNVQLAATEIASATLAQEGQEAELAAQWDDRLLAALRKQLDALQRRLAALREAKSRDRVQTLELQRAAATDPTEAAMLDLKLFCERVLARYFRDPKGIQRAAKRFSTADAERLKDRIALAGAYWTRAVDTITATNGDQAQQLQEQLAKAMDELSRRKNQLRELLARALEDSQQLQFVRERAIYRVRAMSDAALAGLISATDSDRARVEAELTADRVSVDEAMRKVVEHADKVATRLGDAVTRIGEHLAALQQINRRLQWKRLSSRGTGLTGTDWRAAWAELCAVVSSLTVGEPESAPPAQNSEVDQLLFGGQSDAATECRRLLDAARQNLVHAPWRAWWESGAGLVVLCGIGGGLYSLARKKGVLLARQISEVYQRPPEEPHPFLSGLSARMDLLGWNLLGDLALPLMLALSLWLAGQQLLVEAALRSQLAALLLCCVVSLTLLRALHHLFEAESSPHRPIPCGDRVARHYRHWFGTIIVFSLLALPIPLLLRTGSLAPALQDAFLEVYKMIVLLMLLLFVLSKDRVLGTDPLRRTVGVTALYVIYPVLVLGMIALVVLEIVGYGALVTFIGAGTLLTGGVILVAVTATEYAADAIDRYTGAGLADVSPTSTAAAAGSDGELNLQPTMPAAQGQSHYSVSLIKWLLRLLVLVASILCILFIWNVPLSPAALDWRVIGLSSLVLLIALLLDHVLFTALAALQVGGRLPLTTSRFIRRWIRGILTLLCALAVAAVAGYRFESLWSFLAAILAMVAIGFVAVWSILSNILATFIILIWRPFNVGEWIEVAPDGIDGQVVDINFIYTILRTDDGRRISIPNNLFAQKYIRRRTTPGTPERTLAEQLVAQNPLDV